jgi:hypothetical protein
MPLLYRDALVAKAALLFAFELRLRLLELERELAVLLLFGVERRPEAFHLAR